VRELVFVAECLERESGADVRSLDTAIAEPSLEGKGNYAGEPSATPRCGGWGGRLPESAPGEPGVGTATPWDLDDPDGSLDFGAACDSDFAYGLLLWE
jgi:hypothetical protein